MELKLKVLQGTNAGQQIPIGAKMFFIGRSEDCHLRPNSELISRHHCALLVDEGYIGVRDFGSRNGTYVNDQRVEGERELKPGDRLKVGPLEFEVVIVHEVGGKKRPPVQSLQDVVARTAASRPELDVDGWLSEETPPARSLRDTQFLTASSSDTVAGAPALGERPAAAEAAPAEPAAAPAEPAPPEPAPPGSPGKRTIGKLPPVPKPTSKDSREAAAQILDQLRKRR